MTESVIEHKPINVLILAAGLGTRMKSDIAKVLHCLDGSPLIAHVCRTAAALAPEKIFVVIGHQADEVKEAVGSVLSRDEVIFVLQDQQLGTGDAVNAAREHIAGRESTLVVLSGDVPMIRPETLAGLVSQHQTHRGREAACTLVSVRQKDPSGYGRVVRDTEGRFEKIVEQKDATPAELNINEINAGIYCFDSALLFEALERVQNHNAQGEYYLTDVPGLLREDGRDVSVFVHNDSREIEGVNNRAQLSDLERAINQRTLLRLMLDYGVTFIDPRSTYIHSRAEIGRDTIIYPNVTIEGESKIGDRVVIRSGTRLTDAKIGYGVQILDNCVIVDSTVGNSCTVGPFAHLRGQSVMADESKVGNFVELKKTTMGRRAKANHLAYLGDASIGDDTNIGAGTITCNYDGQKKHATAIGAGVRIGSDTMLVAPVTVGDRAVTGAGSVVIDDIPPDSLAVGVPAKVRKIIKPTPNDDRS